MDGTTEHKAKTLRKTRRREYALTIEYPDRETPLNVRPVKLYGLMFDVANVLISLLQSHGWACIHIFASSHGKKAQSVKNFLSIPDLLRKDELWEDERLGFVVFVVVFEKVKLGLNPKFAIEQYSKQAKLGNAQSIIIYIEITELGMPENEEFIALERAQSGKPVRFFYRQVTKRSFCPQDAFELLRGMRRVEQP